MKGNVLEELRVKFGLGKVFLKHDVDATRSVGIIIVDNNLHVGVSLRHGTDQRNKRKARHIALGRAFRAHQVYTGASQLRIREAKRKTPLTFTLETDGEENIRKAIGDLFSGEFFK